MKRYKFLILLGIFIFCFCGCGKQDTIVEEPETFIETENQEDELNIEAKLDEAETQEETIIMTTTDSIPTVQYGFTFKYPVEQLIWEKEKKTFSVNDLKISRSWDDGVYIGNILISGLEPTDLSSIDNYFFTESWEELDLFSMYNESKEGYAMLKQKVKNLSQFEFTVSSQPVLSNQIINQVSLVGITNVFEGGLEELKTFKSTDEEFVTIGNSYQEVHHLLGENSGESTKYGGTSYITVVNFNSLRSNLVLYFTHENENDIEDAVLTSIIWTPTSVNEKVYKEKLNIS